MFLSRTILTQINKGNGVAKCHALLSTIAVPKEDFNIREENIKIKDCNINYIKVGSGPHNVLCMPGALGTIWTDFRPQVEELDKEKFTLVVWDPPGYGKSRPPYTSKKFTGNFYETDADYAYEFMQGLDIPRYSVLGWSGGGISGMIKAAKYPDAVQKLVIWCCNSFILPTDVDLYNNVRDVRKWSKRMKAPLEALYGDNLAQYWANWVDGMVAMFKDNDGNMCSDKLKAIECPTFLLYGERDPMVNSSVHASHLLTHIKNSRLHIYPEGKHNIHLKYADDFNKRVQDFLLEN